MWSLVAHHRGAIGIAKVLLDHGNDPQMIKRAEKIVAAQVGAIEQMSTGWPKTWCDLLRLSATALISRRWVLSRLSS